MGNISGVAVAISIGGPGTIFWMWVTAFLGMITKFYTCSLSVLYRKNSNNNNYGGPMFVVLNGLGNKWKPLALIFCFFGLLGVSPIFQSNQIIEVINSVIINDNYLFGNKFSSDLTLSCRSDLDRSITPLLFIVNTSQLIVSLIANSIAVFFSIILVVKIKLSPSFSTACALLEVFVFPQVDFQSKLTKSPRSSLIAIILVP